MQQAEPLDIGPARLLWIEAFGLRQAEISLDAIVMRPKDHPQAAPGEAGAGLVEHFLACLGDYLAHLGIDLGQIEARRRRWLRSIPDPDATAQSQEQEASSRQQAREKKPLGHGFRFDLLVLTAFLPLPSDPYGRLSWYAPKREVGKGRVCRCD